MILNPRLTHSMATGIFLFLLALSSWLPANATEIDPKELMKGFPPENLVNKNNWLFPPYNRWSFQHIETISTTATINRGHGKFTEMKEASRKDRNAYQKLKMANGWSTEEYVHRNKVDGLLVLKNGRIVAEHYSNNQNKDTRHIMFSVSKSFTGTIAETLVYRGQLDDTKLVSDYVPELAKSGYGDATVRQVMDMLVDLKFNEDYADPYSDISQFIYAAGLGKAPAGVKTYSSLYDYLPSIQKEGEHGLKWEYVSATTETLGWIMSRATNKSWVELFEETIYQDINPRRDALVIVDSLGKEVSAGGLGMTLRDVGRFAMLISNNGRQGSKQIIPKEVVKKIKAGGDPDKYQSNSPGSRWSYKSQWYRELNAGVLSAYGIHGQSIQIGLDNDIIIITQSSWPVAGSDELWRMRAAYQKAVFKLPGR